MREIMANYLQKNLESVATHKNTSLARHCKNTTKFSIFLEKLVGYVIRGGKNRRGLFWQFLAWKRRSFLSYVPTEKGRSGVDVANL